MKTKKYFFSLVILLYTILFSAFVFANPKKKDPQASIDLSRPKFEKKWIQINEKKIEVEIADTELKRSYGLMYIEKLKTDQGMLFIFESEQPLAFWMKNTLVDLSIGYFDKNKKLVDIQDMRGQKSILNQDLRSYPSKSSAQYALEVPLGWFKSNKIKVGNKFSFVNK